MLPLVPPYLIYLTGATIEHVANDEHDAASRRAVMISALLFVLGFSTVFVALGASASLVGGADPRLVGGAVNRGRHPDHHHGPAFPRADADRPADARGPDAMPKPVGLWGAYVMGLAFAFGWTPCIGPILAAILSVAAAEATVAKGAGLLAVYSAGLGIPFLLAAFMIEQFSCAVRAHEAALVKVERAMGVLMVITGIGVSDRRRLQCQHLAAGDFPRTAKFRLGPVTSGPAIAKLLSEPNCRHPSRGIFRAHRI